MPKKQSARHKQASAGAVREQARLEKAIARAEQQVAKRRAQLETASQALADLQKRRTRAVTPTGAPGRGNGAGSLRAGARSNPPAPNVDGSAPRSRKASSSGLPGKPAAKALVRPATQSSVQPATKAAVRAASKTPKAPPKPSAKSAPKPAPKSRG
jgi:hypothetical protein